MDDVSRTDKIDFLFKDKYCAINISAIQSTEGVSKSPVNNV